MHTILLSTLLAFAPGEFEILDNIGGPPGEPGYPEGILVVPHLASGQTHDVFVTEGAAFDLQGETPRVTRYSANVFADTLDEVGFCEMPTSFAGISGIARFADDDLLVLDVLGGGVRLDPDDCSQSVFVDPLPDLPTCDVAAPPCSPAPVFLDLPALPNDVAFAPLGIAGWISDSLQGVVWRFGFAGGAATPWLTAPEMFAPFEGPVPPGFPPAFGPNGIRLLDGDLYIAVTYPISRIWRVNASLAAPTSPDLELVFEYEPGVGADNLAVSWHGDLYVTLAEANAVSVIDPDAGVEIARYASTDLDGPAGIAFWGSKILTVNHAIISAPAEADFAVVSMTAEIGRQPWVSLAP